MASIILTPEIYSTWPFDNSILLLYDDIIIDKNDFIEQESLKNRSTFDSKIYNFLKRLKDELKILHEYDYSELLDENERKEVHKVTVEFVNNQDNFSDVYLIGKQAWFNYSDYLTEKIRFYADPKESAISDIMRKIKDTIGWRDRLFKKKKADTYNEEDFQALMNAVKRTLGKAVAGVKIYQKIAGLYTDINYLLHDGKEYEHAFSTASSLLLYEDRKEDEFIHRRKEDILISDLIYECYRVYCMSFNLPLLERPDLFFEIRKDFSNIREIFDDFQNLLSKFSYDFNITRSYVLKNLERILQSLKRELIYLSKTWEKTWSTYSSVSLFNIPIGHFIRLLIENKVTEKSIQTKIDYFFSLYENKSWRNLFTLLKSFESYESLELTKDLVRVDENYFRVRPDWWIDYLPWYEGGSKHIKTK